MVASAAFERWWRGSIGCVLVAGAAAVLLAFGLMHHPARRAVSATPLSSAQLVDHPVASSGCGSRSAVRPGETVRMIVGVPPGSAAGARTRSYLLHVPVGYVRERPTPLVLAFHGAGGSALGMQRLTQLSDRSSPSSTRTDSRPRSGPGHPIRNLRFRVWMRAR